MSDDLQAKIIELGAIMALMKDQREVLAQLLDVCDLARAHRFTVGLALDRDQTAPDIRLRLDLRLTHAAGAPAPTPGHKALPSLRPPGPTQGVQVVAPPVPTPEATAPRRAGQPWTEDEENEALRWKAAGLPMAEIAERLERPVPATSNKLCRLTALGRKAPDPEPAPAPTPVTVSAPAVAPAAPVGTPLEGMDPDGEPTAREMLAHLRWLYGAQIDPDMVAADAQLVTMLARGDGAQKVAEEFDWPKEQVIARWRALTHHRKVTITLQTHLLEALRSLQECSAP